MKRVFDFQNVFYSIYTVFKLKFPIRFLKKFSGYNEAAETCNTAMERKFCRLLGNVFKNCEKFSYEAEFAFFQRVAESAKKLIY